MDEGERGLPLAGLRVIDAASLYAGPVLATMLGDFGAEVIKVEHPRGDPVRGWPWQKDGESVWWTFIARNKKCVTIKLSDPRGAALMRRLAATSDVVVENFRPGTFERWGLDPSDLIRDNPKLVVARVTGFGQTGPYSPRPGFGTLAEAMSGLAHTTGFPDGPPLLPQWPLADGVAGITGAFATMVALWEAARSGRGQVVDVALYEPLFWLLGAQASAYDQLGEVPARTGNAPPMTVPRNCYQAADGRWVALSGSALTVAQRVMRTVGRPDLAEEPWFAELRGRIEHQDEIDEAVAGWIGQRTADEVVAALTEAEAAVAPVWSVADAVADPHLRERGSLTTVPHPRWGEVLMQGVMPRLAATPGAVRWTGAGLGEHNQAVLGDELGCSPDELAALAAGGVIAELAKERS